MKEQWIEELRQKLADYEEPAPEVSWDEIEKAVANKRPLGSAASPSKERARIVPMWVRKVAAAAAVLLVLAVIGYDALDHVKHTDRSHDLSQNHEPVPSMIQAETAKQDSPAENPLLAKVTQAVKQAFQSEPIEEVLPKAVGEVKESEPAVVQTSSEDQTPNHQEARNGQKQTDNYYPQTTIYPSDLHKSPALRNRLTAKVYLSNAMGNSEHFSSWSNINETPLIPDPQVHTVPYGEKGEKGDQEDKTEKSDLGNTGYEGNQTTYTLMETVTNTKQTHHYQPIRYGLSLRYRLNERWAVETGLTYSLLASDVTKVDAEKKTIIDIILNSEATIEDAEKITQWKQRLNYIGIPLKAEYMLWDSRYLNVYASAGMMVEKMVKGSLEDIKTGTKEGLSIRPLQFSVNGAIGAEFNLSRQFSIYAEPGLGYYFDNGSSVSTFYQDKPLSFNLNVGLRFSFE